MLEKGAVSHNYMFFHSDVIDACLRDGDWQGARRHAELLDNIPPRSLFPGPIS